MRIIPERHLCQLWPFPMFSLFLMVNLGALSMTPPNQVDNTKHIKDLPNVTMTMSKANWSRTTSNADLHRSGQNMSAISMSPVSEPGVFTSKDSPVSMENGTLTTNYGQNSTTATTSSTYISAGTTSSTQETKAESDLAPGPSNSSQITTMTTVTTPSITEATSSPVTSVKATNPSSMTLTTKRVTEHENVSSPDLILASTPPSSKMFLYTLGAPSQLDHSRKTMTIILSSLLGVTALVVLLYTLDRCKQKKTQYLHRPLYNNSEETADRFVPADDTLVISGGLYDGPRVYNPNMTTANDEEDCHCEQPPFGSRTTEFQLKPLKEEGEKPPSYEASTFQSSRSMDPDV